MIFDEVKCPWVSLDLLKSWRNARPLAAPAASFNLVVQSNGVLPGPRFPAKFSELGETRIYMFLYVPFSMETNRTKNTNRARENASFH